MKNTRTEINTASTSRESERTNATSNQIDTNAADIYSVNCVHKLCVPNVSERQRGKQRRRATYSEKISIHIRFPYVRLCHPNDLTRLLASARSTARVYLCGASVFDSTIRLVLLLAINILVPPTEFAFVLFLFLVACRCVPFCTSGGGNMSPSISFFLTKQKRCKRRKKNCDAKLKRQNDKVDNDMYL